MHACCAESIAWGFQLIVALQGKHGEQLFEEVFYSVEASNGMPRVVEMPAEPRSLQATRCAVIDASGGVFVWNGKLSNAAEKRRAQQHASAIKVMQASCYRPLNVSNAV